MRTPLAALIALAVTIGAACSSSIHQNTSAAPPGGPSPATAAAAARTGDHAIPAVILGDSLTVQAEDSLAAAIPGIVIDAAVGRTLVEPGLSDSGLSRIPDLVGLDARWFVVALGTNDSTFAGHSAEQFAADVAAVLDAIGRDRCIAWVLPFASSPRSDEQLADTDSFRTTAATAIESLECGLVLDWSEVAGADPNLLGSDGVHLDNLGIAAFTDLIRFAVA